MVKAARPLTPAQQTLVAQHHAFAFYVLRKHPGLARFLGQDASHDAAVTGLIRWARIVDPSNPRRLGLLARQVHFAMLGGRQQGMAKKRTGVCEHLAEPETLPASVEPETTVDREAVRLAVEGLPDRQRQVIQWRFGLGGPSMTLEKAGQRLGITRERVRQIEERALRQLRKALVHQSASLP
jgi:RNA polymerase sigma factor (sigma-70 family)